MADPQQQPQGMMGFGIKQQDPAQWQLAAALAQMNDSELAKSLMTGTQPNGRMVGDRFVAPSWAESLNGAVKQGIGAMAYSKNMDMKKQFMQAMQLNAMGQGGGLPAEQMPGETIGPQGLFNHMNPRS